MITIENAENVLKSYYLEAIAKQLNENTSPFYAAIEKTSEDITGKDVKLTMVQTPGVGISALSEDSDLPTPHANRYVTYTVPLKNLYGTIEISDKTLRAARANADSMVSVLDREMESLVRDAKDNLSRMLFGTCKGLLTSVVSFENYYNFFVDTTASLRPGMEIDIYNEDFEVVDGGKSNVIVAVNHESKYVTVQNRLNLPISKSCFITRTNAFNNELNGLYDIFVMPDVYGVEREGKEHLTPMNFVVEAKDFDEDYFMQCIDEVCKTGTAVNMIICSFATRRKIFKWLKNSHMNTGTKVLEGGFEAITYNGIPVVADKYCQDENIYIINTDDFKLYQLCDWEWMEDEGGNILHRVPSKAAYATTLVKYAELVCTNLAGQGYITITSD